MSTTTLPSLALAAACLLALTGCDAAEREPETLQDTTVGEAAIGDRPAPGEGAAVGDPETPGATTTAASDTVDVTLVDYEIRMPDRLDSGAVTFRIVNDGAVVHGFEVEGQGQEWAVEEIQPGGTAYLEAALTAGTWEVYCPVGDHAEARGMETTLQIESSS